MLIILSVLFYSTICFAAGGMEYNARHPALSKGIPALNWNPAWRGIDPYRFQLYTELMAFELWNNTLDIKTFEEIFAKHWAEEGEMDGTGYILGVHYILKETVIETIPDEGIVIGGSANPQVGLLVGPVAVRGQLRGYSRFSIDKDILRLFIEGNEFNESYSIKNSGGELSSWIDLSGNIALPIAPLSQLLGLESFYVGGTLHYLQGLGLFKVSNRGDGFMILHEEDNIGIEGDNTFIMQSGIGGQGTSLDLGIYSEIRPGISIGASVMDLMGSIVWDRIDEQEMQIVLGDDNNGEWEEEEEVERIYNITYKIPTSLNLGLALSLIPRFDVGVGLSRIILEDTAYNEVSAGFEWRGFLILPSIRSGIQFREGSGMTLYGGTGFKLGPIHTDVGFSDLRLPLKQGMQATIGLSISFNF